MCPFILTEAKTILLDKMLFFSIAQYRQQYDDINQI